MADNFFFSITGAPLGKSLDIAFTQYSKATHWCVEDAPSGVKRFVLFWTNSERAIPFPIPLSSEEVLPLIESWLKTADYGNSPDIDGGTSKGWTVYTEAWGQVGAGRYAAFAAIEPTWMLHGK